MRASNKRARRSGLRTGVKLLTALVCLFLLYQLWMFNQVVWYAYQDPGSSAVMRQELARLRQTNAAVQLQYEWAPYAQINNSLKRAVIASEDANFLEHDGVEWDAIRKT
jgi:monofunctional glycosyltransferase